MRKILYEVKCPNCGTKKEAFNFEVPDWITVTCPNCEAKVILKKLKPIPAR